MDLRLLTKGSRLWKSALFFVFSVFLLPTIKSLCPAEFKGHCDCDEVLYESKMTYVTNCTNEGFEDAIVLRELPVETEVLLFTGNNLLDLPVNIFGLKGSHVKLRVVDFSDNHIQTIKGRTFHDVDTVQVLILNENDIYLNGKDNHPRMFSNFVGLEELHLRNALTEKLSSADYIHNLKEVFAESMLNKLKVLNLEKNELLSLSDTNFFCSLPQIQELRLAENRLTEFNFNSECLTRLRLLDLSHNYIPYFSNDTLSSFDTIRSLTINLTGNPFRCDCNMVETYKWMYETRVPLVARGTYRCMDGYPPTNIGKLLSEISLRDLQCRSQVVDDKGSHVSATYIVLLLFAMVSVVVAGVMAYRHRHTLENMTNRIRRKFQYDSLEKPEEAEMEV